MKLIFIFLFRMIHVWAQAEMELVTLFKNATAEVNTLQFEYLNITLHVFF